MNTLKISKDQFTRSPNQSRRGDAACQMWGVAGKSASNGSKSRSLPPTSESWPYRQPSGAGRLNNREVAATRTILPILFRLSRHQSAQSAGQQMHGPCDFFVSLLICCSCAWNPQPPGDGPLGRQRAHRREDAHGAL